MADAAQNLPPPSANIINLTIADLVIYAVLFPPAAFITWKHGKSGLVCWPIFLSYFGLRFASDAYQIAHRGDPLLPNTVSIMTTAGSIACLSLTLIGILYEVNIILPYPRRWTERSVLGITHLANTAGIALATYGGAPSATAPGGVMSQTLNQIGNCLMVGVMFTLIWWIWPTAKRVFASRRHPNFKSARFMVMAAAAGIPFQLVRLAYNTTYAFDHLSVLDPVMGSFSVRLILVFLTQLGVTIAMVAGGLASIPVHPHLPTEEVALQEIETWRSQEASSTSEITQNRFQRK